MISASGEASQNILQALVISGIECGKILYLNGGEVLLLITYRRVHYNNTKNQYYIKEHREIVLYVSYYQLVSHFLLYLSEIEDIFFKILYRIL